MQVVIGAAAPAADARMLPATTTTDMAANARHLNGHGSLHDISQRVSVFSTGYADAQKTVHAAGARTQRAGKDSGAGRISS